MRFGIILSQLVAICLTIIRAFDTPVVRTNCGPVRGTQDTASGCVAFLGIPYARPPIDKRRWRPPEPLVPRLEDEGNRTGTCWTGILDGSLPGTACLQKGAYSKGARSSEDCLRLHVHTKNIPGKISSRQSLKPTLVWLHGGGLLEGSPFSIQSGFGAQANLTSENDVVVVSIQYRLAVAGFLSLASLRKHDPRGVAGNYGLLDCIAALQWIQHNVQAFGGDPGRVTVWGQSSGGSLVLALMASPQATGLIHGAISMSGSPRLNSTTQEAENYWHRQVVRRSRCAAIGFSPEAESELLNCLLALNETELLLALPPDWEADVWSLSLFDPSWQYAPILLIDGPGGVLPETYVEALAKEKLDVPLILGVTREESDFAPGQDVRNLSSNELADLMRQTLLPTYGADFVAGLTHVYGMDVASTNFQAQQVYAQILSDATTTCANFYLAGVIGMQRETNAGEVYAYIESRAMEKPFCVLEAFNHFEPAYCPHYAFHAVDEFTMIQPASGPQFPYNLTIADRAHGRFLRSKVLEFVVTGQVADWRRFVQKDTVLPPRTPKATRKLPDDYWVIDLGTQQAEANYHEARCNFWLQAGFFDSRGLINQRLASSFVSAVIV